MLSIRNGVVWLAMMGTATIFHLHPSTAATVDCPDDTKQFSYFRQSCASATEMRIVQGHCPDVEGIKIEQTETYSCAEYSRTPGMKYCHDCTPGRPVCSESSEKSQVCKDAVEHEVCNDGFAYETDTFPCVPSLGTSKYEYQIHMCDNGERVVDRDIFDCMEYGMTTCLNCGGMEVCALSGSTCSNLMGKSEGRTAYSGGRATVAAAIAASLLAIWKAA